MPSLATGDDAVLVGRLRADRANPRGLLLTAAGDGVKMTVALAIAALRAVHRKKSAN